MDRLWTVIIVILATSILLDLSASASDPEYILCWTWKETVCNGEKAFVCPCGDGSYIFASIRDQFNIPMPDLLVIASFESACNTFFCEDVTAITNSQGEAVLFINAGVDVADTTLCCEVTTTVTCLGHTVPYCQTCPPPGGPGGDNDTRQWLSPDMNADSVVNLDDSGILTSDWFSNACRSDFNCDGTVDGLDWAVFEAHYGHACEPTVVGVEEAPDLSLVYCQLTQSYPNPFNPLCTIRYDVAQPCRASLRVFDIAGRLVRTLVDAHLEPGRYSKIWDGRAEDGTKLPSGVYFYRLEAGEFVATRKMVLLR